MRSLLITHGVIIGVASVIVMSAVGIVFGFMPARQAALLNPIDPLRYE